MSQPTDGQITINDHQRQLPLDGLLVEDGILIIQIIERLTTTGTVKGAELYPLGMLRERVVATIGRATIVTDQAGDDAAEDIEKKAN